MSTIPILFTFDNNYVVPALVTFNSLLESVDTAKGNKYQFIICHSDITQKNQDSITRLVGKYGFCAVRFIHLETFLQTEWNKGNFQFSYKGQFCAETIFRCFAASLLPEYDKIIYSDVDVIIRGDISSLYSIDMCNAYFGGVKIVQFERRDDELAHLQEPYYTDLKDSYVAGGILVINSKMIREDNLEVRMKEIIADDKIKKVWPDQDIFNIASDGKVKHIPLRFISYADIKISLSLFGRVINYPMEEVYELFFDPTIIHYAAFKPWRLHSARLFEWWAEYDKIREYINDFGCYRVSRKKKLLFSLMRFIYKKLRFSRFFEIT